MPPAVSVHRDPGAAFFHSLKYQLRDQIADEFDDFHV
jgi:hypothetical protein